MKRLNLILLSLCLMISACSVGPSLTPTATLNSTATQWISPTSNPTETPSTSSPSLPTRDELEHALASRVHGESNALCEWEVAGQTPQVIYVWAYCQSAINDSAVSAPAVIHIGSDGHVQSVDMPRDGADGSLDVRALFPADVQQRIFDQAFDIKGMAARLTTRRAQLRATTITPVPLSTASGVWTADFTPTVSIAAMGTATHEEIVRTLFEQWLRHYETSRADDTYRLDDYEIHRIDLSQQVEERVNLGWLDFVADVAYSVKPSVFVYSHWNAGSAQTGENGWVNAAILVGVFAKDGLYHLHIVGSG